MNLIKDIKGRKTDQNVMSLNLFSLLFSWCFILLWLYKPSAFPYIYWFKLVVFVWRDSCVFIICICLVSFIKLETLQGTRFPPMKRLREPAGCWGMDCFCVHDDWNSGHTWLVLTLIRMVSARSYYPTCDIILSPLSPSLPFLLFLGRKSSKQFCTKPLSYPLQVENGTTEEMLSSSVDGRKILD